MQRETRDQRERRALDELLAPLAPLVHLAPSVGRLVEQDEADRVANTPVVEAPGPAIHLPRGYLPRIIHIRRDHPGFVPAGLPERLGEIMIRPETLGKLLNHSYFHT